MFTEGFVFGNVRIKVLQRVFGNVFSHNNLVVSKDVGERQSGQPAFVVGFHRVESHFSWRDRKGVCVGQGHSGSCRHLWAPSSCPHHLHVPGYQTRPALPCQAGSAACQAGEDTHTDREKSVGLSSGTTVTTSLQPPGHMKSRTPSYTLLKTETPRAKPSTNVPRVSDRAQVPFSEWSTQVKVIPPRWLSLNRNKKVPGILSFNKRRSFSLLTKPMTYLKIEQRTVVSDQTLQFITFICISFTKNRPKFVLNIIESQ